MLYVSCFSLFHNHNYKYASAVLKQLAIILYQLRKVIYVFDSCNNTLTHWIQLIMFDSKRARFLIFFSVVVMIYAFTLRDRSRIIHKYFEIDNDL